MNSSTAVNVTQEAVVEPMTKIAHWADQFKADEIDGLKFTMLIGRLLEDLAATAYGVRWDR